MVKMVSFGYGGIFMGIAALVLGIVSIIIAFVPFCGIIAFLPALVGLILGIIDLVIKSKQNQNKGTSIAGVILSSIAIVIMVFWFFVFGMALNSDDLQREFKNFNDEIQQEIDNEQNGITSNDTF